MGLARAARNLARTARANPMWALLGILLAPFRFARHIIVVILFAMVLFAALFLLLMLAIWYFKLDKNGAPAQLAFIGIALDRKSKRLNTTPLMRISYAVF